MANEETFSARFGKERALARVAKDRILRDLLRDGNCVGAGFGRKVVQGEALDTPALVVFVRHKHPAQRIPLSKRLPRHVYVGSDAVEVDVVQTGPFYAQAFTARERPAPSGISIGHFNITAGTLGCLVNDNTDSSLCILSNNHVLADENAGAIGDAIIQQGSFDGGITPADDIATLKRFVMLNPGGGNTVDAAIGQVITRADVIDQMKDNLTPVASPDHPAVGLLFAGSCNRTLMNPIDQVLAQLDIQLLAGLGSTIGADIGMNVEKVGRTTEYTTSTVTEIDVSVTVQYDMGLVGFDGQIATSWMSDPGDSGSLVCRGGEGGAEDRCGCGSSAAASEVLQRDVRTEAAMAQEVRDKFLRQTLVGRWAIEAFQLNEERFLDRFQLTHIEREDRAFAQKLYDKYVRDARRAFCDPESDQHRITEQHLRDAKTALGKLKPYVTRDEYKAAQRLFEMAQERAVGLSATEALSALNEERLVDEIREILSSVEKIELPRGKGRGRTKS